MAGGTIQVTPNTLRDKAAELRNQNSNLNTQIDTLETQAKSLSGMWEGDAQQAFDKDVSTDIQKMRNFHDAIESYASALDQIASQYESAENSNAQIAATR